MVKTAVVSAAFDAAWCDTLTYLVPFSLPRFVSVKNRRKNALLPGLFLAMSCLLGAGATSRAQSDVTYEVPRAGAARALRLIDAQGFPLQGSFSQPSWELRGGGLFFTREWNGTRNIWRAFPDPQDTKRYPTWRALPVTQLQAPLFAAGAVAIPKSRALLLVTNANTVGGVAQIARYEISSGTINPLTNFEAGAFDPAVTSDGNTMAYAVMRSNSSSVYVQSLSGGAPRRVALNARRPAWQDKATLLLESTVNPTVFRLPLADASRPLKLSSGEQVAVSKDGAFVVLGMSPGAAGAPNQMRLFLMAGDGSGLRAITDAANDARRPAIAPDNRTLCFDAPLIGTSGDRALWVLPLQRDKFEPEDVNEERAPERDPAPNTYSSDASSPDNSSPDNSSRRRVVENPQVTDNIQIPDAPTAQTRPSAPIAQITGADISPGGALAILGLASGEGASATLEFGAGTKPTRWTTQPVALPLPPGAPLALWIPPAEARGTWTVRLTVSNGGGAAQSLFSLRLPVVRRKPDRSIPTPFPANSFSLPPGGPLPRAPLPELPVAPALPALPLPAAPPYVAPTKPVPRTSSPTPRPTGSPLVPRPAPVPTRVPARRQPERSTGSTSLLPTFPNQPAITRIVPLPATPSVPAPAPTPTPVLTPTPSVAAPAATDTQTGRDAATFNISGTLAKMSANQKIKVTFWALNKGSRAWETGDSSSGAVRLVSRWVDYDSGSRRKWNLQWMKETVSPNERTSWSFELAAPPKPGRYKLIYGLVRVPGENWEPPAYNAPQESWPNEFAAIAFAVNVSP
jgi:hypothetical protein